MECSIIQILRSIEGCRATFNTLGNVEFRRTQQGKLLYKVGNSAIVFSIRIDGEWRCAKCYTSHVERRTAIYGDRLLPQELYIPLDSEQGVWLDLLLAEWIEGVTLREQIQTMAKGGDTTGLYNLSRSFDGLALELLESERAHGDITCENILVDHLGKLHLIDFDNSYTPELAGLESLELGTEAYQHPARVASYFDRTIDDYSLALISSALSMIALSPEIFEQHKDREGLLFDPKKVIELRDELHSLALQLFEKNGAIMEYRIAEMLRSTSPTLATLSKLIHYKHRGVHPDTRPTTIFRRDKLWGYLNDFGREVIPPIFDAALAFNEGLAAVRINSTWHYIDSQCRVAINCQEFEQIKSIEGGKARVKRDGEWQEIELKSKSSTQSW